MPPVQRKVINVLLLRHNNGGEDYYNGVGGFVFYFARGNFLLCKNTPGDNLPFLIIIIIIIMFIRRITA